MANLKNIRSQIKSVTSIQKVTKAMKMVAAAKLRKSQENMEKARPYSNRIRQLIAHLIDDIDSLALPLLNRPKELNNFGFLVITADRGLAGSFNSNIIKKTEIAINEVGKEKSYLFCIGKKGYEHFNKRNYNIKHYYKDFWSDLKYSQAMQIGTDIVSAYTDNTINSINVIYNYFKSTGSQETINNKLLPLTFNKDNNSITNIIYEPSKDEIVATLVPKYFNIQIWQFLLESFSSEQAARMIAMENATENAKDLISKLNLEFNKARQSAITTEMLEIVGGAEALSN